MAAAYIPFTFPTIRVQNLAGEAGVILSRAEIDRMWEAYYEATVKDGLPPFHDPRLGGNTPILKAVQAKTGLSITKAAAFLNATYRAVNEFNEGYRWIDPARSDKAEGSVADVLGGAVDKVTGLVKWGAIAVVGGAVIYGLYEFGFFKKFFKRRGKRRKG